MNTCKTCKFWGKPKKAGMLGLSNIADCDMVNNIIPEVDKTFEIDASADDESNMNVALITGENFGCIHHEAKK